jgi:hypothetical protein
MKIAKLHDGSELQFPPETDDAHISAAVRKKLGLPPAEPPMSERIGQAHAGAAQDLVSVMANFLRRMDALIQRVDLSVRAVSDMSGAMQLLIQQQAKGQGDQIENMRQMAAAVANSSAKTETAIKALSASSESTNRELMAAVSKASEGIQTALKLPKKLEYKNGHGTVQVKD